MIFVKFYTSNSNKSAPPFHSLNEATNNVSINSLSNYFFIQLSIHISRLREKSIINEIFNATIEFIDFEYGTSNSAIQGLYIIY